MKLLSPAKVNLFLNVLSKRKDGYHEIETLFQRISLADEIPLSPALSGVKLLTDSKKIPTGSKNLAYRAAQLLRERFNVQKGVVIRLRKKIPVAAGLGGGSSNAATVLLGLNRFWKLGLSQRTLCDLGAELGSDVPFFILETPFAFARGRGEILKKVSAPRVKIWHCLVNPGFKISTKKAYRSLDQSSLTPKKTDVKILLHSIQKGHSSALTNLLTNSLEVTLNKRVTTILEIKKELLRQGAKGSLLSGSGPTVFGIYSSKSKASKVALVLKKHRNWKVFVASTF